MRVTDGEKWDPEFLAQMQATPWAVHAQKEEPQPEVIFRQIDPADASEARPDRKPVIHRVPIQPADMDRFGFTPNCPRCEHALRHGHGQCSKWHSEVCRARIMAELEKTEDGQKRIGRLNNRTDHMIAKALEKSDQARLQEGQGGEGDIAAAQEGAPPKHGLPEGRAVRFEPMATTANAPIDDEEEDLEDWQREILEGQDPETRRRALELMRQEKRNPGFLKQLGGEAPASTAKVQAPVAKSKANPKKATATSANASTAS